MLRSLLSSQFDPLASMPDTEIENWHAEDAGQRKFEAVSRPVSLTAKMTAI